MEFIRHRSTGRFSDQGFVQDIESACDQAWDAMALLKAADASEFHAAPPAYVAIAERRSLALCALENLEHALQALAEALSSPGRPT